MSNTRGASDDSCSPAPATTVGLVNVAPSESVGGAVEGSVSVGDVMARSFDDSGGVIVPSPG